MWEIEDNYDDNDENIDNPAGDENIDKITDDKISLLGIEPIPMTREQVIKQMSDVIKF